MSDALDSADRLTVWRSAILESFKRGDAVSARDMIAAMDEVELRAKIAAEIEAFADDHSDVSDAYRHAALIAKGTQP